MAASAVARMSPIQNGITVGATWAYSAVPMNSSVKNASSAVARHRMMAYWRAFSVSSRTTSMWARYREDLLTPRQGTVRKVHGCGFSVLHRHFLHDHASRTCIRPVAGIHAGLR